MMALFDSRKSFKIGLVVLIQYRLWQTASQPPSHVAVASTALTRRYKLISFCGRPFLLLSMKKHWLNIRHFDSNRMSHICFWCISPSAWAYAFRRPPRVGIVQGNVRHCCVLHGRWLLCTRPGGIKRWCCLTSVAFIRSAGGVCGQPAGCAYWLIGPGSAGLAQGCRCALPLQAWAGVYRGGRPRKACC